MGVRLVEMQSNWRGINSLCSAKYMLPSIEMLQADGVAICEKPTSIMLALHLRAHEIIDIRDWFSEQSIAKVKMFNRFKFERHQFRDDREVIGTNFRFVNENDAVLFKLYWF